MKEKAKKLPVGITQEFLDLLQVQSTEQIKASIITLQNHLEESQVFLKENPGILELREELKEAEAPSRETIKSLKNRTKACLQRLKETGAL